MQHSTARPNAESACFKMRILPATVPHMSHLQGLAGTCTQGPCMDQHRLYGHMLVQPDAQQTIPPLNPGPLLLCVLLRARR